jgi:hypothetical protein
MTSNKIVVKNDAKGRIAVPILLWIAGVPFIFVLIAWLVFFRGH